MNHITVTNVANSLPERVSMTIEFPFYIIHIIQHNYLLPFARYAE
jgi:hypothetical protein